MVKLEINKRNGRAPDQNGDANFSVEDRDGPVEDAESRACEDAAKVEDKGKKRAFWAKAGFAT